MFIVNEMIYELVENGLDGKCQSRSAECAEIRVNRSVRRVDLV